MNIYVYADVLFALNFCMDFLIIYITGKFFKIKTKKFRLILGSAFSAFTFCLIFFQRFGTVLNFAAGVATIISGLAISFFPVNFRRFMLMTVSAHIIAAAIGGICMAVYFITLQNPVFGKYVIENFSIGLLIFASVIFYILLKVVYAKIEKSMLKKQVFYGVKISLFGKETTMTGMADTGHSLIEPISKWPVIISEFYTIKSLLPESVRLLFYEKTDDDISRVFANFEAGGLKTRVRLIPFRSIGEKNGLLIGIRPDKVTIIHDDGKEKTVEKVIIGIYNEALSSAETDMVTYHALINPTILDT